MKYLVYILLTVVFVSSCQNNSKPINYIYSSEKDSIEREEIFAALGDTIFANVLYGMSYPEAKTRLDVFKDLLTYYPGFKFGNIRFQSFNWASHIERIQTNVLDTYIHDHTLWWNDELIQVIWNPASEVHTRNSIEEIDNDLNYFIGFFEKKYGKSNSRIRCVEKSFFDNSTKKYAIWKTKDRCIEMNVWFDKGRNSNHKLVYWYNVRVRFYNPYIMDKVMTYIEERKFQDASSKRTFEQMDSLNSDFAL